MEYRGKSMNTNKWRYWYETIRMLCVGCGKFYQFRQRVYNENDKGLKIKDYHCDGCFDYVQG